MARRRAQTVNPDIFAKTATGAQGDEAPEAQGAKATSRQGDKGTEGQGDKGTEGQGDKGTEGQGDTAPEPQGNDATKVKVAAYLPPDVYVALEAHYAAARANGERTTKSGIITAALREFLHE